MGVSPYDYIETGGLFWGPVLRRGLYSNFRVTWPFVDIVISAEFVRITVKNWGRKRVTEVE